MKHWLMLQGFTALNTMYRQNPGKQTTYRSPKRNEKQMNYIITKRRHLKYNKDAEANNMIPMGSDHGCVMATFMITTPKRDGHRKIKEDELDTTKHDGKWKNIGDEKPELEKKYQEIIEKIKEKAGAANKELSHIKDTTADAKKSSSTSKKWECRSGIKRS